MSERKEDEFEITPEMLRAGGSLVEAWDYGYPWLEVSNHQALAKLIYYQMRPLEPEKKPNSPIPSRD